jgi:hypothetical protein
VTIAVHPNRARYPALAVSRELETAIRDLGAADNPFGRLLALRNGAKALAMSGCATNEAVDRLLGTAVSVHGLNPSDVAAAIDHGCEMARVAHLPPPPMLQSTAGGTPNTTVEALMFSLRRGLLCGEDPGNRDRLRRCDADAITEIAERLTALGWPDERIERVILAWRAVRGDNS